MWVLTQKKNIINLDHIHDISIETIENENENSVARISAYNADSTYYILGEYRNYAAKKIMEQIALYTVQNNVFIMPDEEEANEQYKN